MNITAPEVWIGWIIVGLAAYLGAYLAEKAKRRAAHEDSAQIRDELVRNTQAIKEIEAKVNGDLWNRQWRLNQKRDAYANLLTALSRLLAVHIRGSSRIKHGSDPYSEYKDPVHDALAELDRIAAMASIFCTAHATEAVKGLYAPPNSEKDFAEYTRAVAAATVAIQTEARRDLGLTATLP